MGRVIQFRAKEVTNRKSNREWIYGYHCAYRKKICGFPLDGKTVNCILKPNDELICTDSDTLGQYTGIRDMKERKIFEGDIIQYSGEEGDIIGGYVMYKDDGFIVRGKYIDRRLVDLDKGTSICVIGNIYDNGDTLGMKGFKDLVFEKVGEQWVKERAIMFFDNGYGVSIISGDGKMRRVSEDTPYEMDILHKDGAFGVPDVLDVLGYMTEDLISEKMYLLQSDL